MATTKQVELIAQDIAQRAIRDIEFSAVYEHMATDGFTDEELELVHDFATKHVATLSFEGAEA